MLRVSSAVITLALLTACRNTPPSTPEVVIEPGEPTTVDDLVANMTLDSVDADKKDVVSYAWKWTLNGTVRDDLTTDTVPAAETSRGDTWTVTLSATDGEADATAEASVLVGNTAPELTSLELDSASPGAVDDIVATALGTDADGDELTYAYSWTVDGQPSDISARRVPASLTEPEQTWVVTATALDDELESEALTATAVVGNSVPTVEVLLLKPAEPSRLSTLSAEVSASDPDGSDVTVSYSWLVGGTEVSTEETLSASGLSVGDSVSLTVSASDGIDSSSATSAVPLTIVDLAPTVTAASLTPSTPTKAGPVSAVVAATDMESDPITFTYRWFVAGTEVLVGSSDTLSADLFNKGEGIRVEVEPNDGYLDGPVVSTGVYTVGNTAPTVESASIDGEITKTSGADCTGHGFADIDGDPEGYEVRWLVNGSEVSVAETLSGNLYNLGDSVQCVLSPFDGTAKGTAVNSNTVVAKNALPKVASVALSTTSPREGDVLSVTLGNLSDLDGDTVTVAYEWTVNGSAVSTGSTLAGDQFSKGDTITVTVTPNDGVDDGAPVTSDAATVLNTLPGAPELVLAPDYPNESEDLQCVVADPSVDADGDDVTYEISWTVDGSPWSGSVTTTDVSGDTVPAGSLVQDQVWLCEATPSDDEGEGASAQSAETTISPPSNGSSQGAAGESCKSINDLYPGFSDGTYWIDPNLGSKNDAYEVFCDMTADGGGWTLLAWTGNSGQQPYGVPLPGYHECADMSCLRGTLGSPEQILALIRASGAFAKGQSGTTLSTFAGMLSYQYAGQYVYGDLSTFEHRFDNVQCNSSGAFLGVYRDIKGTATLDGGASYMGQGFKYQAVYDFTGPDTQKIWNVGVPGGFCAGGGEPPGSFMGNWNAGQFGPGVRNLVGSMSVYVR